MSRPLLQLRALCSVFVLTTCLQGAIGCMQPRVQPTVEDGRLATPIAFRVHSETGAQMTLLGSIHVGPPEGWAFTQVIERAFERATTLVLEVDPRSVSEAEQQRLLSEHALLPSGRHLQDVVSDETWSLLQQELEHSSLSLAEIDTLRPWMVANLLVIDAGERGGYTPLRGVEQGFLQRVGERTVLALESFDQQLALMAALSDELQESALNEALRHSLDMTAYLESLIAHWSLGDADGLETLLLEDTEGRFERYYEALIYRRNHQMAAKLIDWLQDRAAPQARHFVIVGAGHLVGPRSILTELEAAGMRVEPLVQRR